MTRVSLFCVIVSDGEGFLTSATTSRILARSSGESWDWPPPLPPPRIPPPRPLPPKPPPPRAPSPQSRLDPSPHPRSRRLLHHSRRTRPRCFPNRHRSTRSQPDRD